MTAKNLRVAVLARSVYPLHPRGGLERHVYDLVRHLLKRDAAVTLITRPPTETGSGAEKGLGHPALSVHYVPYRTFPFAGRRGTTIADRNTAYLLFGWRAGRLAAGLVRQGQVDVVHGLGASSLGYVGSHRRDADHRAPLVFNPQGLEEFGSPDNAMGRLKGFAYRPLQLAVRRCAKAADRVIATDKALLPNVVNLLRVSREKVRIVPNAVDLELCGSLGTMDEAHRLRGQIGLKPRDLLLLSVGRVEANKGFQVLARALAELAGASPLPSPLGTPVDWKWVLVGDGPFRPRLKRLLADLRLGGHAVMVGRASDPALHSWYRAATVFVHPTLYEGSSLVTLEAMTHGRPVIASATGGLPDKVRPGVNGWLVSPGQSSQLADAIREALSNSARLAAMGTESRSIVAQDFSWNAAVVDLLNVYAEVLNGSTGDRRGA